MIEQEPRPTSMTASLKGLLEVHIDLMKTDQEKNAYIDNVEEALNHYKSQFQTMPAGKVRAHSVNSFIDELIEESRSRRPEFKSIVCQKGCAHCCHNTVVATEDEVDLLIYRMEQDKITIDLDLLKRQAEFEGNDSEWFHQPKSENRCVFLDESNSCRVYEHRPASCRKYFVITEPSQCDDRVGSQKVGVVADMQAELAYSAMMDIDHSKVDALPRVLFKRLGDRDVRG